MSSSDLVSERETRPASRYRVLAACDFSPLGDCAVIEGLQLCGSRPRSTLHVITVGAESLSGVVLPGPVARPMAKAEAHDLARQHVSGIIDDFLAHRHRLVVDGIVVHVTLGTPAAGILSLAAELDVDLIVLGTHGRSGLTHLILGSVTGEVMRRATCGVFIIRPRDFLRGEKLPEIEPPLRPGQHSLLPCHTAHTYHNEPRANRRSDRIMPSI